MCNGFLLILINKGQAHVIHIQLSEVSIRTRNTQSRNEGHIYMLLFMNMVINTRIASI